MKLTCSVCKELVIQSGQELIRKCPHTDAPVIADMSAVTVGQGACNREKVASGICEPKRT